MSLLSTPALKPMKSVIDLEELPDDKLVLPFGLLVIFDSFYDL